MRDLGTFARDGFTLIPQDSFARKIMASVKDGHSVFVEVWSPRNMRQHRKFFAILNNVVEATGRWTSTEHLRRDVLIALHRYDEHVDQFTGEIHKVAHSMAVASMPKDEFEKLYADTINLLTEALGCDPQMLIQQAA